MRRQIRRASLLLVLASVWLPLQAATQETVTRVLERIRIQDTRHFSYRETRTLQLMAAPWQATGDLYISPQQMVIAQQTPKILMTIISADRLLHIDVEQDLHRNLKLEQPFAVPGMEPFMRLLYGSSGYARLEQDYVINLATTGQRWSLQLAPRQGVEHDIIRLQISGTSGRGPDRLVLEQQDGDRTEWQLSLLSQGLTANREMQQTLPTR